MEDFLEQLLLWLEGGEQIEQGAVKLGKEQNKDEEARECSKCLDPGVQESRGFRRLEVKEQLPIPRPGHWVESGKTKEDTKEFEIGGKEN